MEKKKKKSIVVVLTLKITSIVNGVQDKQKELKDSKSRCIMYVKLLAFFFKIVNMQIV